MLYKTEIKFKELESFLKRVKLKLVTSNPQYCTGRTHGSCSFLCPYKVTVV